VKSRYVEAVQDVVSVIAAYCDLWGVCTHASQVTAFWLVGRIISPSCSMYMGLMMLSRQKYSQQNH